MWAKTQTGEPCGYLGVSDADREKACAKALQPLWVCPSVSGSIQNISLPGLPWGPCELWVTASTIAGQGPPGPSLRLHLPGRGQGGTALAGAGKHQGLQRMSSP